MRLRLFRAAGMAEAIALVRAALGDEAVILGSRRCAEGMEVTAALEPAAEPTFAEAPEPAAVAVAVPWGLARHNPPAGLARRLADGKLAARLAENFVFGAPPTGADRPLLLAGPPGAGKTVTCAKLAARAVLGGAAPLVVTCDAQRAGATEQLAAFTRLLGAPLAVAATAGQLAKALTRHGGGRGKEPTGVGPTGVGPTGVGPMGVGPAGAGPAGKGTAGKGPAREGPAGATCGEHSGGRPRGQQAGRPVLIDTAGCDPFLPADAALLHSLAQTAGADVVLVLPAGLDAAEAADLARAFLALGARWLLPTRLDSARRLGGVLAAADAGLALAEGGIGPGAADGLVRLTPDWLAARLLAPFDRGAEAAA